MAKFIIYDILYEKYIKEFNSLDYSEMIKYGDENQDKKIEPLDKDVFNDRLESDLDFNKRWYDKI